MFREKNIKNTDEILFLNGKWNLRYKLPNHPSPHHPTASPSRPLVKIIYSPSPIPLYPCFTQKKIKIEAPCIFLVSVHFTNFKTAYRPRAFNAPSVSSQNLYRSYILTMIKAQDLHYNLKFRYSIKELKNYSFKDYALMHFSLIDKGKSTEWFLSY